MGLRSERGPTLLAVLVTIGLVAVDSTVLATAIPTIVDELGDFSLFPWLFSIYLLTQAVTVPVYSKLSDMVGRKPIILLGIGIFLVGSVLCGLAWSMPALIVARAIQGIGAGAVQPTAVTIVGDIYTVAERARVQGYISAVWGIAAVVGPTLGGVFAQFGFWRGIFFINVPLGLFAAWLLVRHLRETVPRKQHKVDIAGAMLLMSTMSLLILGLLEGGHAWAWMSWQSIGCFGGGLALLISFVAVERRAAEPVFPLWVFSRRLLRQTVLISLGMGAILMGLTSYVPTYLEGSLGVAPIVAGLALAALTLGWPISAAWAGHLYLRFGFRFTILIGLAVAIVGAAVLVAFASTPSVWITGAACFIIGLGMGFMGASTIVSAQSSVGWSERGVATGANMFARSVGSAVGVAIFGAIANAIFGSTATQPGADDIIAGSTAVFAGVLVVAIVTAAAGLGMPKTTVPGSEPVEDLRP
ncbi:MFS transporter [Cryobacterium sp. BB736]|uniref:MFS transporter n=1 Tax=Cryobacterium sp. BB736 TaxID=2746963 RepID=UPI00351C7FC5